MKKLIAANWKMYKTGEEADAFFSAFAAQAKGRIPAGREVLFFVPATILERAAQKAELLEGVHAGAENLYPAAEGAFTGEISPAMIRSCGAEWVLAGHSERRHLLGESEKFVGKKVSFALENGLRVMLCIGETLEEREDGLLENVLERQLRLALASIPAGSLGRLAIAYEPVWAIGTGKTAQTEDILEAHALCRRLVRDILGEEGDGVPLLYGGSVKPSNAEAILALDNVDGVLVGGASLKPETFLPIALSPIPQGA